MQDYERTTGFWIKRTVFLSFTVLFLILFLLIAYGARVFVGSLPVLVGKETVPGLAQTVTIDRDRQGVATITAGNRIDLARSLGYLHAQERFFQMDLLRRSGAGELSSLFGAAALDIDKIRRQHRFRARADSIIRRMPADDRALLDAYAAGVNAGLARLGHVPFEYGLLRVDPAAWTPTDTLLTFYALYCDLQEDSIAGQRLRLYAPAVLGPELARFLYPRGTTFDAPLDGSLIEPPPLPGTRPATLPPGSSRADSTFLMDQTSADAAIHGPVGSNAMAIAGRFTATGAAIVESDMHLGLRLPNTWFRARLKLAGSERPLDLQGLTLPGSPYLVSGSNGAVAWGLTASYVASGDAVLIETVPNDPTRYATPDGEKSFHYATEQICPAHGPCETITITETIWGPVLGYAPTGKPLAWRWAAYDQQALDLKGLRSLEEATTVRDALTAAHHSPLPQVNLLAGDRDGHIGWTVAGPIARRRGLDDKGPQSWADGSRGWAGYLNDDEIPERIDPPEGYLWSANQRMVGGGDLALYGDNDYALGARASVLRADLADAVARGKTLGERDLLAIALDTRSLLLIPWQEILVKTLKQRPKDLRAQGLLPFVQNWGGKADRNSPGYRLVRQFRSTVNRLLYRGLAGQILGADPSLGRVLQSSQGDDSIRRLLSERPENLVPVPFKEWDAVLDAVLAQLYQTLDDRAEGKPERLPWGAVNRTGIIHPLSPFIPGLSHLTDAPDEAMSGDDDTPRVVRPGFGASARFVVSPGHEETGIFHMPGGPAANPFAPYYLAGHEAWVEGRPTPFLPDLQNWRLTLAPAP